MRRVGRTGSGSGAKCAQPAYGAAVLQSSSSVELQPFSQLGTGVRQSGSSLCFSRSELSAGEYQEGWHRSREAGSPRDRIRLAVTCRRVASCLGTGCGGTAARLPGGADIGLSGLQSSYPMAVCRAAAFAGTQRAHAAPRPATKVQQHLQRDRLLLFSRQTVEELRWLAGTVRSAMASHGSHVMAKPFRSVASDKGEAHIFSEH